MQPIKIKEISISNYKGIDSLKFTPRDINIIVGKNNTGKSSLLNAISLSFHALNGFMDDKNEGFFDKNSLYPTDHQIYESNKNSSSILLTLMDPNINKTYPIELIIDYGVTHPPDKFNIKALEEFLGFLVQKELNSEMKGFNKVMRERGYNETYISQRKAEIEDDVYNNILQGRSNTLFFKLKYQKDVLIESYMDNFGGDTRRRKRRNELQSQFRNFFINSAMINAFRKVFNIRFLFRSFTQKFDVIQFFKKLSQTPNFYNVLDKLKEKLNYIYDIRESEGNLNIVIIGSDGNKIFVPFELMGDGFQSLLMTTILFELLPVGFILLEEPENSLHPGYMDILVSAILKKSETHQIFFSTHSLDFIKILMEKAEKTNKLDNVLLLRLSKLNNKINREILLKNKILEELDQIKVDLRGY